MKVGAMLDIKRSGDVVTRVLCNPYRGVIDDDTFAMLIHTLAKRRSEAIESGPVAGEYTRSGLGMCMMNPTTPRAAGVDSVMALIAIGEGHQNLVNAIGKAVDHHDFGQDCGIAAHVRPHLMRAGCFLYGFSAEVDGTIVGASRLTEIQDRSQATQLAAEFNEGIAALVAAWKQVRPDEKWFGGAPSDDFDRISRLLLDFEL